MCVGLFSLAYAVYYASKLDSLFPHVKLDWADKTLIIKRSVRLSGGLKTQGIYSSKGVRQQYLTGMKSRNQLEIEIWFSFFLAVSLLDEKRRHTHTPPTYVHTT